MSNDNDRKDGAMTSKTGPGTAAGAVACAACGARVKSRPGGPTCRKPAMSNGRCRTHGGASLPGGRDAPGFKHGKFSRWLPERLLEKFALANADPEVMSMREDIALLQARITELVERIDRPGVGEAEAWDAIVAAIHDKARLARAEWQRLVVLKAMIPVESALAWAAALLAATCSVVKDASDRRKVNVEFKRLLNASGVVASDAPRAIPAGEG